MRNDRDSAVIERMIKHCEDVDVLLERFDINLASHVCHTYDI